jgi:hypothetical protein
MSPLVFELAEDGSELMLAVQDGGALPIMLNAAAVDALMRRLAECRAKMAPVHPAQPPSDPELVYQNDNLLFDVTACRYAPAIEIAMQHPGLGWTVTRLGREQAEDFQVAIEFALQDIPKQATAV